METSPWECACWALSRQLSQPNCGLWPWCHSTSPITNNMAGASQHCVPCHNMCPSFWMEVGTVWVEEMAVVFVVSMPFTVSLFACAMIDHSGFMNQHSKCTWSTVFLLPHLHLSVCCAWREIWCATCHAWLWVWSQGICVILIHATLLTLITMCVVHWEPWCGLSAQCTSRVPTLLSHHLFPSTNHGGCFITKCVLLSTLSMCCGGGGGCVSSLSSPRLIMWHVLVRRVQWTFL